MDGEMGGQEGREGAQRDPPNAIQTGIRKAPPPARSSSRRGRTHTMNSPAVNRKIFSPFAGWWPLSSNVSKTPWTLSLAWYRCRLPPETFRMESNVRSRVSAPPSTFATRRSSVRFFSSASLGWLRARRSRG